MIDDLKRVNHLYPFYRSVVPVACSRCADVIYCSEQCREEAANKFHKYECGIVPILWRSGASINNHIALRIIASKPLDYFLKLKPTIDEELSPEKLIR